MRKLFELLHEYVEEDVTEICRDIMECITELPRNYGAGTIAAVLRGSQNAKVKSYGLEAVESYGKQKQTTEPRLKEIIGELLAQGYLWATPDKYALIHLEEKGEDFLEEDEKIVMKFSKPKEKKTKTDGSGKKIRKRAGLTEDLDAAPGSYLSGCVSFASRSPENRKCRRISYSVIKR